MLSSLSIPVSCILPLSSMHASKASSFSFQFNM
jgi:hypothetical protein